MLFVATPNSSGEKSVQWRQVIIADGRKERACKNGPCSCDSPLLLFQKPDFFVLRSTVDFR
jgi:hypothetical protein